MPFQKLITQLEEQLNFIAHETHCPIKQAALSVPICRNALAQMKAIIKKRPFEDIKDEIHFFKRTKPNAVAKLIFYRKLFHFETDRPKADNQMQREFYLSQLEKLRSFTEQHVEFYRYYRSESNFLDEKYFLRGKTDMHLLPDEYFLYYDDVFNTSHDHLVAQFLASEMIEVHIQKELIKLKNDAPMQIKSSGSLEWTENKIALIELMYAIHAAKCVNSGNVELSEIASAFERIFNIELKDYYRKYIEIKGRKNQQTKFLEQLITALQNKITNELQ
jgi:hypothetical protein